MKLKEFRSDSQGWYISGLLEAYSLATLNNKLCSFCKVRLSYTYWREDSRTRKEDEGIISYIS
jgi:hypothetical protein